MPQHPQDRSKATIQASTDGGRRIVPALDQETENELWASCMDLCADVDCERVRQRNGSIRKGTCQASIDRTNEYNRMEALDRQRPGLCRE
jgi:hypothetical protein